MSFSPLPLFAHSLTHNSTRTHTSTNGRGPNASTSNSNTRLNASPYSLTSPGGSITSSNPSPTPSKPRQKSKTQSRLKTHHVNTTDSRSKSKAKAESKPKDSNLRLRVKRGILLEAPDIDTTVISDPRGPDLRSQRDSSAENLKQDQHGHDYLDDTEDDETEGEAETDRDTEAAPDISVDAETSHRTLTVDPFSAEEERIITVLSRKLEQLRESETTSSSPIEAASPPVSLPLSPTADSIALQTSQALRMLEAVPVPAKSSDNGGRLEPAVAAAGRGMAPSHKHSPKRISPPPISTTSPATLNGGGNKGYPTARPPPHAFAHSRTSSVDSGIYASPPSPARSSPESVYAAPTGSPINYRNGSSKANTSARTSGKATSNGHAVPIAVSGSLTINSHTKGKGSHHDDEGVGDDVPIEFGNTYNRTYGTHISTLSSPEMSLSASPCEPYDTRWMGTKANPNGIGFATANGNVSFPSNNVNGKAGPGGFQTTQTQRYEQESESQTQTQQMLHALMQENEHLKNRIANMEGNYLHLARLNEAYREELIGYRRRLGLSVDNLIGLASDPLPASPTSARTHAQSPHTFRHPPSSPLGNAFNNHGFNSYTSYIGNTNNGSSNANGNYQYHHASSPSNSTSILNPSSATTRNGHRPGASYVPSKSDYIPNGSGYENSLGIAPSETSTNGVPIPRPASQLHTNRLRQLPMMTMPMSVPNAADPRLFKHGSTSRTVNEPQVFSTSASSVPSPSYSSPPYSTNSPALFSPSYSSSYSAASSAASSSATSSASASTNVTSPPSSLSFTMMMMLPPTFGVPSRGLTYPLVPPPSLSSSLGSGSGFSGGGASGNLSPVDPSGPSAVVSRRGSNAGMSVGRRGSLTGGGAVVGSAGARVMDTGSLRRSRGGSLNHGPGYVSRPETVDETEGDHPDVSV